MNIRSSTRSSLLLAAAMAMGCAGAPVEESSPRAAEGARIWRTTCNRCHNLRPPNQYSADEWPVIVRHMRTRTDLTRSQTEAVAGFLRRASGGGTSGS